MFPKKHRNVFSGTLASFPQAAVSSRKNNKSRQKTPRFSSLPQNMNFLKSPLKEQKERRTPQKTPIC